MNALTRIMAAWALFTLSSTTTHAQFFGIEKQLLGDVNIISNGGFENGTQDWTASGSSVLGTESAGANLAVGDRSASWDATADTETLTSDQVAVPNGVAGERCVLEIMYKGGDTNLKAQVIDGSSSVLTTIDLVTQAGWARAANSFNCPDSGTIAARLIASADAAIVYLDQVRMGMLDVAVASNVSPVVYSLEEQTIGTVGSVANEQQDLSDSDFTTPANARYFHLDSVTESAGRGDDLTNDSVTFTGKGFFGRENIAYFNGSADLVSSSSFYQPGDTDFSTGVWVKGEPSNRTIMGQWTGVDVNSWLIWTSAEGGIQVGIGGGGGGDIITPAGTLPDNEWFHIALTYDAASNTTTLYLNGQAAGSVVKVGLASTDDFGLGARDGNFSTAWLGEMQEFFFDQDVKTPDEINAVYSRRFKNNAQLAGGHELDADSISLTSLEDIAAFWNMDSISDNSGATACSSGAAACDLTNTGTVLFTSGNIFAAETGPTYGGGTQYLESADLFLAGDGGDMDYPLTMAGWFRSSSQDSNNTVIGQIGSATNDGLRVQYSFADSVIRVSVDDLGADEKLEVPFTDFASWHHVAAVWDQSSQTLYAYIDGVLAGSTSPAAQPRDAGGTATFALGGFSAGSSIEGSVDEVLFIRRALNDEDIKKLASSRIDLPASLRTVSKEDQLWTATYEREDQHINWPLDPQEWVLDTRLDQATKKLYVDLGDLGPGADATIKLQDLSTYAGGLNACKTEDSGRVSVDPMPITHGLGSIPVDIVVQHRNHNAANSKWAFLDPKNYNCEADATTLDCDFSALTIDGTQQIYVAYSTCPGVIEVPDAEFAFTGSVGSVGAVANEQGLIDDTFLTGQGLTLSEIAVFSLDGNLSKTAGTATATLSSNGTPTFSTKGILGAESVFAINGAASTFLNSTDAHFNPGDTDFTIFGWYEPLGSTSGDHYFSQDFGGDRGFRALQVDADTLRFQAHTAALAEIDLDVSFTPEAGNSYHLMFVHDSVANQIRIFINGQLAGETALADNRSVSSPDIHVGSAGTGADNYNGSIQEFVMINGTALSSSQANEFYSRRFTNTPQLAGGHELSADSFARSSLTTAESEISFWNLDTLNDGSGNADHFTAEGDAAGGNAVGIMGDSGGAITFDGTGDSIKVTDADKFGFTSGEEFTTGCWIKAGDPAVGQLWISNGVAGGDRFIITGGSAGQITVELDPSPHSHILPDNSFRRGEWFHIVARLNSDGTLNSFLNGVDTGVVTDESGFTTNTTGLFRVSGRRDPLNAPANFEADECFWSQTAMSDSDIKKLASTKIVHSTGLGLSDQEWFVTVTREDAHQGLMLPMSGAVDTHDTNNAYYDFSGHPAGSSINIELKER